MRVSEKTSLYEYLRSLISLSSLIVAIHESKQQHQSSCQGHSEIQKGNPDFKELFS